MQQLYYNGTIITMEDTLYADAVLVEDGIIRYVGAYDEAARRADPSAQRIDLNKQTMLPAFIDAHSHFSAAANAFLQVPLDGCASFADIRSAVASYMKEQAVKPGEWVIGNGYDQNSLAEKKHPTLALVDELAPNNPMVLQHKSGHMGVFNSKALQWLGVTDDTPSAPGGKIEKENGHLTGYMEENDFFEYLKKVPLPSTDVLMAAFGKTQEMYTAYGITTVQDGMMVDQMIAVYQPLLQSEMLKVDLVGYVDVLEGKGLLSAFHDHVKQYKNHFKIRGYKAFLDGSPQGRTAWMRTPYKGDGDYCGYNTLTDEQVKEIVAKAKQEQMQLLAHCNGDAASAQYIRAAQAVTDELGDLRDIRPVIIHAQLLGVDQLDDVKRLGLMPSFFVAHVYYWGDVHIENFGKERAATISPAHSALEHQIRFSFHQDSPVIKPDMLETVWCAVTRTTKEGVVLGPQERISALEALKAITIHAAYQYGEEATKGSLAEGKHADFVILAQNPLTVDADDIRNIAVMQTIKDGQTLYRRKS